MVKPTQRRNAAQPAKLRSGPENFSDIGNFTVNAVEVKRNINCSPFTANLTGTENTAFLGAYTHMPASDSLSAGAPVYFRLSANGFSTWIDNYWSVSDTRAITRLVFAALNNTIEGGRENKVPLYNGVVDQCKANDLGSTCPYMSVYVC